MHNDLALYHAEINKAEPNARDMGTTKVTARKDWQPQQTSVCFSFWEKRMRGKKLSPKQVSRLVSPLTTALIALRLGICREEHYYDLLCHVMIAGRIAELVPRRQQVREEIREATSLLGIMHERWAMQKADDAFVEGTPEEMDIVDAAIKIYESLLRATPYSTVQKAMLDISNLTKS